MKPITSFTNLKIGHRILALVAMLLFTIAVVGAIGVYKMRMIGQELEEVAKRNIPLTHRASARAGDPYRERPSFQRGYRPFGHRELHLGYGAFRGSRGENG